MSVHRAIAALHGVIVAALLAHIVPAAQAAPREVRPLGVIASNGVLNSSLNTVVSVTLTGGYELGRIDFTGTLSSGVPSTWRTDARVLLTAPGGQTALLQPFVSGSTFTTLQVAATVFMPVGTVAAGEWTLRFFESVDDGGATVDATWDLTMTVTDDPPSPPLSVDLGELGPSGLSVPSAPIATTNVLWYRFTVPCRAGATFGTFVDVDTFGTSVFAPADAGRLSDDTEIALYNSQGLLVAQDDDSGIGATSLLSFGSGTRAPNPPTGNGDNFTGQNGALEPGVYYLAVALYNTTFGPARWSVSSAGTLNGTIALNLRSNISAGAATPQINQQPVAQAVTRGSSATFTVTASTSPPTPLAYQWLRSEVQLADGPSIGGGVLSGTTSNELTISNVGDADAGQYSVVVNGPCSQILSSAALLSVRPPNCIGDADGSGTVSFADITSVLSSFGATGASFIPGDADGNGVVNFSDISAVLSNFGANCG